MTTCRQVNIGLATTTGLLLVLSGFLSYFFLPSLVEQLATRRLILSSPESDVFKGWQESGIPIHMKFYFFNITNHKDFLDKNATLVVNQVGPYTFRETRTKVNITWNHENGTLEYQQIRRWYFVPEQSNGSLSDEIIHVNMPMIGGGNECKRTPDICYTLDDLLDELQETLFKRHTIGELTFDGYTDELMLFGSQFGMEVPYDKFGWFYGYNNSVTDGVYRIFTGEAGTTNQFGLLNLWNNQDSLHYYETDACNSLAGTTTGDLRPPFQEPSTNPISLFIGDICRTMSLSYVQDVSYDEVKTNRYWLSDRTFDYDYPENQCYCGGDTGCPLNGIFNASKCKFDSPIAMSFPHFLYGDHFYLNSIDGLQPDPNLHSFYVDVDPKLGLFVSGKFRLQANVLLERNKALEFAANFKQQQLYIPLFWTETSFELSDDYLEKIDLLQNKVPYYSTLAAFFILIVGGSVLLTVLIYTIRIHKLKKLVNRPIRSRPAREYEYKMVNTDGVVNGQSVHLCSTSFSS